MGKKRREGDGFALGWFEDSGVEPGKTLNYWSPVTSHLKITYYLVRGKHVCRARRKGIVRIPTSLLFRSPHQPRAQTERIKAWGCGTTYYFHQVGLQSQSGKHK